MAASGSKVRRREKRAGGECIAHGADGRRAHERHIGQRNDVRARGAGCPDRAGEARTHPFGGVIAGRDFTTFRPQFLGERPGARTHYGDDARQRRLEVPRGLQGNRHTVGQRMRELVGAEPARRAGGEQQPDYAAQEALTSEALTSQAEGSKRRAGFAAQLGSLTPWRTAVISARIATAISGGVFEPMYSPTGPRSRAISPSERSNSRRRTRRASLFFLEPMAPT